MGRKPSHIGHNGRKDGQLSFEPVLSQADLNILASQVEKIGHRVCNDGTPTSLPSMSLGGRQSKRSLVIKNSSPHDSETDDDEMDLGGNYMKGPSRLVFKEVAVPLASPGIKLGRGLSMTPSATSNLSSPNEYDTPETSAAPTPAELDHCGTKPNLHSEKATMRTTRFLSATSILKPASLTLKGKRKRNVNEQEEQFLNDELLAHALQKEEYSDESLPTTSRHDLRVNDTEDELDSLDLSSLSELDSDGLSDVPDSPKAKKARTSRKQVLLPTRNSGRTVRMPFAARSGSDDRGDMSNEEADLYTSDSDAEISDMDDSLSDAPLSRTRPSITTRTRPLTNTASATSSIPNATVARHRRSIQTTTTTRHRSNRRRWSRMSRVDRLKLPQLDAFR